MSKNSEPWSWDRLPTVSRLMSRPVASFKRDGSVWEIGWNGTWVECWAGVWPPREGLRTGRRVPFKGMPAAAVLEHSIHTDDPAGIEA